METNTQLQPNSVFTPIERLLRQRPVILQLLRFGAIGVINAALDFLVLNFISKAIGINEGYRLGLVSIVSFAFANIQSYYWNKSWAFGGQETSVLQSFYRLVVIGSLGSLGILAVLIGAKFQAPPLVYLWILVGLIIFEIIIWRIFGLRANSANPTSNFGTFFLVSLIGLTINGICVAILSSSFSRFLSDVLNPDLIKNFAKVVATLVSLVWNFIGYKLIVFKK